jgi:hypothetical protein
MDEEDDLEDDDDVEVVRAVLHQIGVEGTR